MSSPKEPYCEGCCGFVASAYTPVNQEDIAPPTCRQPHHQVSRAYSGVFALKP